jgi:parallel beta-helix repeat protein
MIHSLFRRPVGHSRPNRPTEARRAIGRRRRRVLSDAPLSGELLETRALLAITGSVSAGTLQIDIDQSDSKTTAYVQLTGGDTIQVSDDADFSNIILSVPAASVTKIGVNGLSDAAGEALQLSGGSLNVSLLAQDVERVTFINDARIVSAATISTGDGNLICDGLATSSTLTLQATAGSISLDNTIEATQLSIEANGIAQSGGSIKAANVTATAISGDIYLAGAGNMISAFAGSVTLSSSAIAVTTGSSLTLGIGATGVDAADGGVTIEAGGNVSQAVGTSLAARVLTVNTTSGDISLGNAGNVIEAAAADSAAGSILIASSTSLDVGVDNAGLHAPLGTVTIVVDGAVNQNAPVVAAAFVVTAESVALDGDGNDVAAFAAMLVSPNATASFTNTAPLSIGVGGVGIVAPTGSVTLRGSGAITQTASIQAGILRLTADLGDITLTNASNQVAAFAADVGEPGAAVSFTDAGSLLVGVGSLGITTDGGTVTLLAGGSLTQSQPIVAAVLDAHARGGILDLSTLSNDVQSVTAKSDVDSIVLENSGPLTIGVGGRGLSAAEGSISVVADGIVTVRGPLIYRSTLSLVTLGENPPVVDFVVSSELDAGNGSLRSMLGYVRDNAADLQPMQVTFDADVSAVSLTTSLPAINRAVTIDGRTNHGDGFVDIVGSGILGVADGLVLGTGSDGTVVSGLAISGFGSGAGVKIVVSQVQVIDCLIGLTSAGNVAANLVGIRLSGEDASSATIGLPSKGNIISGNTQAGILVENGATATIASNTIGRGINGEAVTTAGDGILLDGAVGVMIGISDANVISGNGGAGIRVINGSTGCIIEANMIGLDASGQIAAGNATDGIAILESDGNVVRANVVSGNGRDGIRVSGSIAGGNLVVGNSVGTSADGSFAVGNVGAGIHVIGVPGITIGGTTAAERNVVSGNKSHGILVQSTADSAASEVVIVGNYVGLDIGGTARIDNSVDGIRIEGAGSNAAVITSNVVSGNGGSGIVVTGGARDATITSNIVGVDAVQLVAVGNIGNGIVIDGGSGHVVGGSAGNANVVGGNDESGIVVSGDAAGVRVEGNLVGTTAGLGNGADGIAIIGGSDAVVQANVASANNGAGISVQGPTTSNTLVVGNRVGTTSTGLVAQGNAQGGIVVFEASGTLIGGTAGVAGNLVSGNLGPGISLVNAQGTSIEGNLVGLNANGLSAISNLGDGISVVGSSDTRIFRGNVIANNGVSRAGNGILVGDSTDTVIGDLATGRADGNLIYRNGLDGIRLTGDSSGTIIVGNMIGTTAAGTLGLGNVGAGIGIDGANGAVIGGRLLTELSGLSLGNLIVGNADGIRIDGALAGDADEGNVVLGNVIRNNAAAGISIANSTFQTVGGDAATAANTLILNGTDGIRLIADFDGGSAPISGHNVSGNLIGTDVSGSTRLGNGRDGIAIVGSVGNLVGGGTGQGNTIVGNRYGVFLSSAAAATVDAGNVVAGNVVQSNRGDGIRLEASSLNTVGSVGAPNVSGLNGAAGITLRSDSQGNVITGNLVGTDAIEGKLANVGAGIEIDSSDGNMVSVNTVAWNNRSGIVVSRATANTIGGSNLGNLVQSNVGSGILLNDAAATVVRANRVDANGAAGIQLVRSTGGTIDLGNVFTRNGTAGVLIGNGSHDNTVNDNFVGTDATRNAKLGNTLGGIVVSSSLGNVIGSLDQGNIVRFNTGDGIQVTGATTTGTATTIAIVGNDVVANLGQGISLFDSSYAVVAANTVGGEAAGEGNRDSGILLRKGGFNSVSANEVIGNGRHGIELVSTVQNTIGGQGDGEDNVVGLNRGDGLNLASGSVANIVVGNKIGLARDGAKPLANGGDGIEINAGIRNLVQSNVVANGMGYGIVVIASLAPVDQGNMVAGNIVTDNLAGVLVSGSTGTVVGGDGEADVNMISGNRTAGILVAANSSRTSVIGNAISDNLRDGVHISASSSTMVVNNSVDSNAGAGIRLEKASGRSLLDGNTLLANTVTGNAGSGITLTGSSFNTIGGIDAGNKVTANGSHGILIEAGSNSNTIAANLVGTADLETAAPNDGDGVRISASLSNLVHAGNVIATNLAAGLRITDAPATTAGAGNRVSGNAIVANVAEGVTVVGGGFHTIGGSTKDDGNTILENGAAGVLLRMAPGTNKLPGVRVSHNTVTGNQTAGILAIGGGRHAISTNTVTGSIGDGISLNGSNGNTVSGNQVGGSSPSEANVNGMSIVNASSANLVAGNTIAGNTLDGVLITGAKTTDNIIGTRLAGSGAAGTGNVISANGGAGVRVNQATRNQIGGNSVFANLGGAIVLVARGNGVQPAPVLSSATRIMVDSVVRLQVTGQVRGTPRQQIMVEFFSNPPADGNVATRAGYQARVPVGRTMVTVGASGTAVFTAVLVADVPLGNFITAAATTASGVTGNTSALSFLAVEVAAQAASPARGRTTPSRPAPKLRTAVFTRW